MDQASAEDSQLTKPLEERDKERLGVTRLTLYYLSVRHGFGSPSLEYGAILWPEKCNDSQINRLVMVLRAIQPEKPASIRTFVSLPNPSLSRLWHFRPARYPFEDSN